MNGPPIIKEGATQPESARRQAARAFIASADWKVLSVRSGKYDPAENKEAPVLAVWFAKGVHKPLLRDVLELLGRETELTNPVVDSVVQPGKWFHRYAEYRRDGGAGERGDISYTVYRTVGGGADGFATVVENGCATTTTADYRWDQAEIIPAPAREQGFSRQIGGVGKDPVTKLFNYVLTTVEQHTFHDTKKLVSDTKFAKTYSESWSGLRGTKDAPVDDEGTAVNVPNPGSQADGTLIQTNWSHDDRFCTWSVRVITAEAKTGVVSAETCGKDLYTHGHGVSTSAEAAKLGHAPDAVGGLTVKHSSRLREDGKWDNTVDDTRELPVPGAEVSTSVDLYTENASVTGRHLAEEPPEASVEAGVITQVSVSKTPGDRRNIQVSTRTEKNVPGAVVSKSSNLFEDTVESQEKSAAEDPEEPVFGDGVVQRVTTTKTPGDLRDISRAESREKQVDGASVTEEEDLFRARKSHTDRNSAAAAPEPSYGGGVGIGVYVDKTPGGRANIRVNREEEKFVEDASVSDETTIFMKSESTTHQASPNEPPASSAGSGVLVSVQAAKTPLGRKNISIVTRTEQPVEGSGVGDAGDIFKTERNVTNDNVADPGVPDFNPEPNVLVSRTRAKTPGDLRKVSDNTTTFNPVSSSVEAKSGSMQENSISVTDVNQLVVPGEPTGFTGPGNPIISRTTRKTPAGAYDVEVTTDTPGPFLSHVVSSPIPGTDAYEHVVSFINATGADLAGIVASYPMHHISPGYSWNKFALMTGSIKFTPWIGRGGGAEDYIDETNIEEVDVTTLSQGGVWYKRTRTVTFSLKRDQGVSSGLSIYSGALTGSSFQNLGGNWYAFKKVTRIVIKHEEIFDITDSGGVITEATS